MEKIVLIGAGGQNFGLGIISDIFKSQSLEGCEIFLHDIDKTTLANMKIISNDYKEKLGVNIDIKASTSRKEALEGATFCIISIEVGNFNNHDKFETESSFLRGVKALCNCP